MLILLGKRIKDKNNNFLKIFNLYRLRKTYSSIKTIEPVYKLSININNNYHKQLNSK